ncbi:cuticle protein 7-like [Homarus americanus]|nr:cuticle protein 7-like [Homarus americanus]
MFKVACVVVSVVMGVVMGTPIPDGPPVYGGLVSYPAPQPVYTDNQLYKPEPKPYAFDYGVQDSYSGANFGHSENSDGNAVKGSYTVALPDGRIQTVTYVADHNNGFQAQVSYEGQAVYPEHNPSPYSQPGPSVYQPGPSPYA